MMRPARSWSSRLRRDGGVAALMLVVLASCNPIHGRPCDADAAACACLASDAGASCAVSDAGSQPDAHPDSADADVATSAGDACALDHGGCAPHAACSMVDGEVTCGPCADGYRGDGQGPDGCADIDECARGTHDCESPLVCVNRPGSYRCEPCAAPMREVAGHCEASWTQRIVSSGAEHARGIAIDADANVLVAGSTTGALAKTPNEGGEDAFLVKYDASGSVLYTLQLGTKADELVSDVVTDEDGNAYLVGSTEGRFSGNDAQGGFDIFVAKVDPSGVVQWIRQFGSAGDDTSAGSAFALGALSLTGFTEGDMTGAGGEGSSDGFLAQLGADGALRFLRQFGTAQSETASSVGIDATGNAFVAGDTAGVLSGERNLGAADAFLVKYDAHGTLQWARELGTIGIDSAVSVASVEASNAYILGITGGALAGSRVDGASDVFLAKYDASGSPHWMRQFGSRAADAPSSLAVDNFGSAWVAGSSEASLDPSTPAASGLFVAKYSSAGIQKWVHMYPELGAASATDLAFDAKGHAYVVAFTTSGIDGAPVAGDSDSFVLKLDADGQRL